MSYCKMSAICRKKIACRFEYNCQSPLHADISEQQNPCKMRRCTQGLSLADLRNCLLFLGLLIVRVVVTPLTALFFLPTSWSSLWHFNDAVCVWLLMILPSEAYLFFPKLGFYPLFAYLAVLVPFWAATRHSFPGHCVVHSRLLELGGSCCGSPV